MATLKWKAPLDPVELKDYAINWSAEMTATSDTIASSVWGLPAEAVADGLEIDHDSNTTTTATVWFHVPSVPDQTTILGKAYDIENTVTTAGGRILNISSRLRIKDK